MIKNIYSKKVSAATLNMLQEILKQATSSRHDQLEKLMFVDRIMNGTLSVEEYKTILTTNYLVHYHLENLLFDSLDADLKTELDIYNRKKLPALLHDLQEMNINPSAINTSVKEALVNNNTASILGAMYVLEGATLGGNVIVKKLKINPNLQPYNLGFYYYQVYGADLVARWKQFCMILNSGVLAADYDQSIQSALKTFDYFGLSLPEKNPAKPALQL